MVLLTVLQENEGAETEVGAAVSQCIWFLWTLGAFLPVPEHTLGWPQPPSAKESNKGKSRKGISCSSSSVQNSPGSYDNAHGFCL